MISLLCPTRKRPHNLRRLHQSILDTASKTIPVELYCYVDDDDQFTLRPEWQLDGVRYHCGPRMMLSDYWNVLAAKASYDILMMAADDIVFRTPDWNQMIVHEFSKYPDRLIAVHGDDMGPSGKVFATLPIIHRNWHQTIGYFAPPGFAGDYSDTWVNDVADMIGRKRFVPFIVEHLHWIWNKAPHDSTYREKEEAMKRQNSGQLYSARLQERFNDATKLRAVLGKL